MTIPISILSGSPRREPVVTPAPAMPAAMTPMASLSRETEPMHHTAATRGEASKAEPQPTWENVTLAEINQTLKLASIGVQFEFDKDTDTMIARVVDVETGKLIRQMPSEEVMQLSKALGKLHDLLVHQAVCRKAQLTDQTQAPAPARWSSPWVTAVASGPDAGAFRSVKV
ncbi:flagellar protein FlaG [Polaromonas sp.]|uniref:flagellar protein FlaG n=1 Tax=Polaromonas sp. TaxID=1869339 RepID=UPI003C93DFFF